jgi:hypothetical protein
VEKNERNQFYHIGSEARQIDLDQQQKIQRRSAMEKYLDLQTYNKMTDESKARLHKAWREDPNIKQEQIYKALGYHSHSYYAELDRLGVEYTKRPRSKKSAIRTKENTQEKKLESSCAISFSGIYDPQQLHDQIEALKHMIAIDAIGYKFDFKLEKITD